jgi:hypothetical protein
MPSARAPCLLRRVAFAGRVFRPLEFFCPARALAFLDKVEDPLGRHARAHYRAYVAYTAMKYGLAGSTLSNPANNDLCWLT